MTAELAWRRVQIALYDRLTASTEVWGDRCFPYQAVAGEAYPYVVYFDNAVNDARFRQGKYSRNVLVTVHAVSKDYDQVLAAGARIVELFEDTGRLDSGAVSGASALTEGSDWYILTVTVEREISFSEPENETSLIYHFGAQLRMILERQ